MSELPSALRRWRQKLALFPDYLAAPLGALLARLSPAFDAFSRRESAGDGEVDGYEGLANRGHYERLLSTEWAVNHQAPLEFLRRAASGEHLFLNLVRKRPAAPRGTLVLFDAGPDQVGAPRLAQLAVLILLAERSESRAEAFGWQLVHHLGEPLFTTVDVQTVTAFLHARTALRSSDSALSEWWKRYPAQKPWLVGSRRLLSLAGVRVSRVEVVERVGTGDGVLEVAVNEAEGASRSVELQVPGQAISVRLLRDPFAPAGPTLSTERAPRLDGALLLNPQGSRVFFRGAGGGLAALRVPNSPRQGLGKPKQYVAPAGMSVVAVGTHAKKTIYLAVAKGTVTLHATARLRHDAPLESFGPGPLLEPGAELWPLIVYPGELRGTFVAADRSLWAVDLESKRASVLAEGVQAVAPFPDGGGLVAVDSHRTADGETRPALLHVYHSVGRLLQPAAPWRNVFLRLSPAKNKGWAVAFEASPGLYRIESRYTDVSVPPALRRQHGSDLTLRPPSDTVVVGVDWVGEGGDGLGLYLLQDDGRELFVTGRSRSRTLVRSASRLTSVALASASGIIAYTNDRRELGFVERSGKTLWRGYMENS